MRTRLLQFALSGSLSGPLQLILFVTYKCNCRCSQCFFWKDINAQKGELRFEEYEKLSKSIGRLHQLSLSGGEPYLREDLAALCELFWKNNRVAKISIPTNGSLPDHIYAQTKKILQSVGSEVVINVSIDGFKETHEYIRQRKGIFEEALQTCSLLKKLKENYRFTLRVLTIISNKNILELKDFCRFVKKEIAPDLHSFEIIRGNPKDKDFAPPHYDQLKDFFDFYGEFVAHNYAGSRIYRERFGFLRGWAFAFKKLQLDYYAKLLYKKTQGVACYADKLVCVIYPNGDYAFCELFDPIGNVRDYGYDIIKLMRSAEIKKRQAQIRRCTCIHSCFQNYNTLLSPRFMIKAIFPFRRQK